MSGKKLSIILSLIKALHNLALKTAGHFDLDAELKIWVSSLSTPIIRKNLKVTIVF
ncbi:PH domain-containing protein [Bacillus pacificus]